MEEIKYEEYYVAHLDILGFKDMIKKKNCEEIFSIFARMYLGSQTDVFSDSIIYETMKQVKHIIMSDSIVLYIEASLDDSFFSLLSICHRLQVSLADQEKPVLLRGGITKGKLFVMENIIYGEALVEAYTIEEKIAIYPRIIFSQKLLHDIETNCKLVPKSTRQIYYFIDDDEFCTINYMSVQVYPKIRAGIDYIIHTFTYCQEIIDSCNDISVRNKYIWLKRKILLLIKLNENHWKNYPGWDELITTINKR